MTTSYRFCLFFRRRFQQPSTEPPEAIKQVFAKYSRGGMVMGAEELQRFLVEVQGDGGATRQAAQAIVETWQQRDLRQFAVFNQKRNGLSIDAFFKYLLDCEDNQPLSPALGVNQDMSAPLSHYFIYTGHNSYLTGNQLSSQCSDVPIIKALERGVRVIELDLWPNSTKDNVDVLHGKTLTTPVDLLKCLRSIREHAFSASQYPVIVTLEDHLTPDLQAKVAKMLIETFGGMLYYPKSEYLREFPSPEDLKMKIIISTKPPKEYLESKTMKDKDHELHKVTEEVAWGAEVLDLKNAIHADIKIDHQHSNLSDEEKDHGDGDIKPDQHVASEYKRLIGITLKKRKGGMSEVLTIDPYKASRLSLSEQVFEKATVTHGMEIVRFTQRNLLRIYPRATRFTSSNFNPLLGWIHGAQMVASNMQGYGRSLWLVHGMFRANGGCGYVKKPDILLADAVNSQLFKPKSTMPVKKILKVTVYMGDGWRFDFKQSHFDTYSPPDFYTKVGIAGVPADTVMNKTKIIRDKWIPFWDEEFMFPLTVPELALLRIEVHEYDVDQKDDFAGQICLPVWELRPGIRSVPLFNFKGEKYKSVKLLMRFEFIQSPV